jgi:hypothetical protein
MMNCNLCRHLCGRGLVNQSRYTFCVLAVLEGFCQHMLRCILRVNAGMLGPWQHILSYILYPLWHGMDFSTKVEIYYVFSLIRSGMLNASSDILCVVAGMGGFWSTHVAINFHSALAWEGFVNTSFECLLVWDGFGKHMLICILCPG